MSVDEPDRRMREVRQHFDFCIQVHHKQHEEGRHCFHEHPLSATSQRETGMINFVRLPGVIETKVCIWNGTRNSNGTNICQETHKILLIDSPCTAQALNKICLGSHDHLILQGNRATKAQVNPPELYQAICRGFGKTEESRCEWHVRYR